MRQGDYRKRKTGCYGHGPGGRYLVKEDDFRSSEQWGEYMNANVTERRKKTGRQHREMSYQEQ